MIMGRVVDEDNGSPLVGAQIVVEGSTVGTTAGLDGRYRIPGVPAGRIALRARLIGYGTKTITEVVVPDGQAVQVDISLATSVVEVEGISVTMAAARGSVAGALNAQRTASAVVNAITAEQIGRSPDGDAAAAIRRVNGLTVQDDKYVVVRGLGERYTTTTLNGIRLPSPEPERRVVPLDMFPSGLLQSITTSKTFTPDQSGDFSGGQVDIRTKEFPGRPELSFSASTSVKENVIGKDMLASPTAGLEWLAAGASERALPGTAAHWGNFRPAPGQEDVNAIVRSFRNVWSPVSHPGQAGGSFAASAAGTVPAAGQDLGFLASVTYANAPSRRAELRRAQAIAQEGSQAVEVDRFDGESGSQSVSIGGLMNLGLLLGDSHRLLLDGTYNRSADSEARRESGFSENLGQGFDIRRLSYVQRTMYSGRFGGEHQLGSAHRLDWTVSASGVRRDEPDRSEIVYQRRTDPHTGASLTPAWFSISNEGAVRTFSRVDETAMEGLLDYTLAFDSRGRRNQLKVGGLARFTERDAENTAYSFSASLPTAEREKDPESIFDGHLAGPDDALFRVIPLSQGGSYAAADRVLAAYAMLEYRLTDRLLLIGGARVERSELELDAISTLGDTVPASPDYLDVLPSLALTFEISDRQNLRLSASQTLSRPEYRELANLQYREVLGGDNVLGNPDLKRALIQNLDVRWEFYPSPTESYSVAAFSKRFENPIEQIYLATSGTRIVSFANARRAENFGVELEARKRLDFLADGLAGWTAFGNLLLMSSEIEISAEASSQTNTERAMVGQSPYAVNAGITYAQPGGRGSATLLYNVSGRRIASAAEAPLPDVYEEERHLLDLSVRFDVMDGISTKVDVENLLDAPYKMVQGSVVREFYRVGRSISLGLSWRP